MSDVKSFQMSDISKRHLTQNMDYNKDIQKDISIDTQGRSLVSFKESLANKEENDFFVYISKRTEKVVTALYMVTDLMDNTEPIKDKLRKASVDLLSETHFDRSIFKIMMLSESIISFIKLSSSVGLISEMNQSILDREFFSIVSDITKHKEGKTNRSSDDIFGKEFFGLTEEVERLKNLLNSDNGQITDTAKNEPQNIKDKQIFSTYFNTKTDKTKDSQGQREARKQDILNVIKRKKEVTVKDISEVISGVSEKTLQRELVSMVAQNVLKKSGEKRWSRYSIRL